METGSTVELLIRDATASDLPRIVEMGIHFRSLSKYADFLAENKEVMRRMATTLIKAKTLLLLENESGVSGMLGYVVYPHFISGEIIAGEIFWWVEPRQRRHGMKLLEEMSRRAKLAGATQIQMVAPDEKTARVYRHFGFEFVESSFQKSL